MTKVALTVGREVFGEKEAYDVFQNALIMYFNDNDALSISVPQGGEKKENIESREG